MFIKCEFDGGFYMHECDAASVRTGDDRDDEDGPVIPDRCLYRPNATGQPRMTLLLWNGAAVTTLETEYPVYLMSEQGKTVDKWTP